MLRDIIEDTAGVDVRVVRKRVHSRCWHAAKSSALKSGMAVEGASTKAAGAAKAALDRWAIMKSEL